MITVYDMGIPKMHVKFHSFAWHLYNVDFVNFFCFCISIMPSPFPALSSPGKAWAIKDI